MMAETTLEASMAPSVRVTPQQAANKWKERLSAATTEIEQGVARVTVAPGMAAAAQLQKYLTGVQESAQKWRANVSRVSLGEWQDAMKTVGIPRIASGAAAKVGKVEQFQSEFQPHLEKVMAQVHAMPSANQSQRIQRAVAMMEGNAKFKRGSSN
jgi:hypothetical protein